MHDSGLGGLLSLSQTRLSLLTSCRFVPTHSTLINLTCKVTINLTNKVIVDLVTFGVTQTITFVVMNSGLLELSDATAS